MALPVSGDTLNGAYVYQVIANATVGVLVGVTAADLLTSANGSAISFFTDPDTGLEAISYTLQNGSVLTQDIDTADDLQSATAFTYTSDANTFIVSNVPLSAPLGDVTVGNLTALVGGLGDLGLTPGADDYTPCYLPGTLIRTPDGDVAIEKLRIGDSVVTLTGEAMPIRWIGRRSYDGAFLTGRRTLLPVCIKAGALGDGLPRRDLFMSPQHAMYLDGVLVPAKLLVNGVSVTQADQVESVQYIHVELDRHAVIWAEGAASESFIDDDSRGMFQNAHEFHALYPGQESGVAAAYCAPRVEDGEKLAAIKAAIDVRAGLPVPGLQERLRGRVEELDGTGTVGHTLKGWAQNPDKPEIPVCLDVLVDGVVAARTCANLFRSDLRQAGMGSGRHGFSLFVPGAASASLIEVRRVADGTVLGSIAPSLVRPGAPARSLIAA